MAGAVAPELFCEGFNIGTFDRETIARNCESSLKNNICCGILEETVFSSFSKKVQKQILEEV